MDYRDYQAGGQQQNFWFRAKAEFINILLKKLSTNKKLKILDIGAGTGEDIKVIKKYGDVYALDVEQQALDLIPSADVVEKKLGDACDIPYEKESFDVVVAFDVLEHVEDDQKMVDEVHRVLKKDGAFVFTVPAFNFLFSAHDRALHHYRRYNKKMVKGIFTKFTPQVLSYWFFSLFLPAAFVRLRSKNISTKAVGQFPAWLDKLFYKIMSYENWLIEKGIRFPFGLSVYGIYRKSKDGY